MKAAATSKTLTNVQSIEALIAVSAFQVMLCPVAARVAGEVLDAMVCIVALEALIGTLHVGFLRRRVKGVCVRFFALIYHGREIAVSMDLELLEAASEHVEVAYPYLAGSITNYTLDSSLWSPFGVWVVSLWRKD